MGHSSAQLHHRPWGSIQSTTGTCHLQAEDGLALVPKEVLLDVLQENKYLTTPGGETWEPLFKEHNTIKGF